MDYSSSQNKQAAEAFVHGWPNGFVFADGMRRDFDSSQIDLNISNSKSHDVHLYYQL